MLYVILGQDAPGALEIRRRVRSRHLERIGALVEAGRVALAGPCPAVDSPDPGIAGFSRIRTRRTASLAVISVPDSIRNGLTLS